METKKKQEAPTRKKNAETNDNGTFAKNPMSTVDSSVLQDQDIQSIFNNYVNQNSPAIWTTIKNNNMSGVPSQSSDLHKLSMKIFRVSSSSGVEKLREMYIEAYGQYIFTYRARGHPPSAYLDTLFSKIKKIKNEDPNSPCGPYYGVRIIKCNKYEDIVANTQEKADKLYTYLCQYGILSQFANYHEQIDGLGAGKYARVFRVKRNADSMEFAVKVYDTNKVIREDQSQMIIYEIKI